MFASRGAEEARITLRCFPTSKTATRAIGANARRLPRRALSERSAPPSANCGRSVAADAALAAEIGDPWADIAALDDVQRRLFLPYRLLEFEAGGYSELFDTRVRWSASAEERGKPEDRAPSRLFRRRSRADCRELFEEEPVEPAIEEIALAFWLSKAREFLTADDPLVKLLLGRESPEGPGASAGVRHQARRRRRTPAALRRRRRRDRPVRRSADPLCQAVRQARRGRSARNSAKTCANRRMQHSSASPARGSASMATRSIPTPPAPCA